jgi:hypothetical protein
MDLLPEEKLLAALVRLSIRDATQSKQERIRAAVQREFTRRAQAQNTPDRFRIVHPIP